MTEDALSIKSVTFSVISQLLGEAIARQLTAQELLCLIEQRFDIGQRRQQAVYVQPPSGVHVDCLLVAFCDWLASAPYAPQPFTGECVLGYSMARTDSPRLYKRFVHDRNALCMRRRLDEPALFSRPGCIWQLENGRWKKVHSATSLARQ